MSLILFVAVAGRIHADEQLPPELQGVGIEPKLGQQIPLNLSFTDETNKTVKLADYYSTGKPVVLIMVYYECPMLCTLALNSLTDSLKSFEWTPGAKFQIVTVSINPAETSRLAAAKKEAYLNDYGRQGAGAGWHFLVGRETAIRALTDAIGFRYKYDPVQKQYAHATGLFILSPQGELTHFLPGIGYELKDLRLALVESSGGKVGSIIDRISLFCYHYDPKTGRYTLFATRLMQLGGAATLLALGSLVGLLLWRERRTNRRGSPQAESGQEPVASAQETSTKL